MTAAQQRLLEWCQAEVSRVAGYPDDGQISKYLISLPTKQQLSSYANGLFGPSNDATVLVQELWSRRQELSTASTRPPLHREDSEENTRDGGPAPSYGVIDNDRPRPSKSAADESAAAAASSPDLPSVAHSLDPSKFGRGVTVRFAKAKKGSGGSAAVVRGVCSCAGREHPLFTNCTACGRVLCVVEGEGECAFCTSYVTKSHTKPAEAFVQFMEGLTSSGRRRDERPAAPSTADAESAAAEGLQKAEAHKQRLLSYSAANVARSRVIDQQADYHDFESNAWMSAEQKAEGMAKALVEERKLDKRRDHTVSIDLVSGRVIAHSSDPFATENAGKPLHGTGMEVITKDDEERMRREAAAAAPASSTTNATRSRVADPGVNRMFEEMKSVSRAQYYSNDTLTGKARVVYERMQEALEREEREQAQRKSRASSKRPSLFTSRLQHDDDAAHATFDQEEVGLAPSLWGDLIDDDPPPPPSSFDAAGDDEPNCRPAGKPSALPSAGPVPDAGWTLSMHQPWASLLVMGVKRFEGRGWSSAYRGRLWIASTAHQSTAEENAQLEAEYRAVYDGLNVPFPSSYPHSALLGCVDLVDVVDQERFQRLRKARGEREDSASVFIFVCERPRVLPLPISISGQHKLWQLPRRIVDAINAANSLVPVSERWRTGKARLKDGEETEAKGSKRKTLVIKGKKGPRMPNEA